jgi:hypothetical protein
VGQWSAGRALNALANLRGWRAAWWLSAVVVAALRLGLGAVMAAVWLAIHPYLPASLATVDPMLTGGHTYGRLAEAALGVWPRWDAVHYLGLARLGYFQVGVGESVFYPLYPLLVRGVAPVVGGDDLAAGLLVSTLAAVVVFAMLYQLGDQAYGPDAARLGVVAMAVYPTAFFLLAPFTESVFIGLTLATFVAAGARRWWLAGLVGALASLARGPGILTAAAIAWIAWTQRPEWRGTGIRSVIPPVPVLAGVILPVAAGAGFVLWRAAAGFPPMGSVLLQYSHLELIDPLRGLALAVIQFVQVHDLPTTLDVASALLFLGAFAAMVANPRWRRVEWLVYVALNLATFLSKQSIVASSLQSLARYVLSLFPVFILAGDWLSRRSQRARFVYFAGSSIGLLILAAGYSLWWFIG